MSNPWNLRLPWRQHQLERIPRPPFRLTEHYSASSIVLRGVNVPLLRHHIHIQNKIVVNEPVFFWAAFKKGWLVPAFPRKKQKICGEVSGNAPRWMSCQVSVRPGSTAIGCYREWRKEKDRFVFRSVSLRTLRETKKNCIGSCGTPALPSWFHDMIGFVGFRAHGCQANMVNGKEYFMTNTHNIQQRADRFCSPRTWYWLWF